MGKKLYYTYYQKNNIFAEQEVLVQDQNEDFINLSTVLNTSQGYSTSDITMHKNNYQFTKATFILKSNEDIYKQEISSEAGKLILNNEKEIWIKGRFYNNNQFLFMYPMIRNSINSEIYQQYWINVILQDISGIVKICVRDLSEDKFNLRFDTSYPSKSYVEYNKEDLLLDYCINIQNNIEIRRK